MKLLLKEKIYKFFGFGYVVNENSKEIHRLKNKHINCHTDIMVHKRYITKRKALSLLDGLYDGCRFCWEEKNTG